MKRHLLTAFTLLSLTANSCMMESYSDSGRDAWSFKETTAMIFRSEVSDIASHLSSVPDSLLFRGDFADTIVSSFPSRVAYAGDSIWVFSSLDNQISLSSARVRMLPEQTTLIIGEETTHFHFWEVSVAGRYDEWNGYRADFSTESPFILKWEQDKRYTGSWILSLTAYGIFDIQTTFNGKGLDKGSLVINGSSCSFLSSAGNVSDSEIYF